MVVNRIGLVPTTGHKDAPHLHRAMLIISREAVGAATRYGRAALGSLCDDADVYRLGQVGALVVWGSEDAAVARALLRHRAALVILVQRAKPRKDSAVAAAVDRLVSGGMVVQLHTITARGSVVALDVAPGRVVLPVTDLRQPVSARTHSAPHAPRPAVTRPAPAAPSTPRPAPFVDDAMPAHIQAGEE